MSKCTKGKIEVSSSNPNYIYVLKNGSPDGLFAECDAGDYARSKEEGEANADELVRRWNAFEEGGIVEELRTACEAMMKAWNQPPIRSMFQLKIDMDIAYEKLEAALAKS